MFNDFLNKYITISNDNFQRLNTGRWYQMRKIGSPNCFKCHGNGRETLEHSTLYTEESVSFYNKLRKENWAVPLSLADTRILKIEHSKI